MDNNNSEIKSRIDELISNESELSIETLNEIINDIKEIEDETQKKELFNYIMKELSNEIKTWDLSEKEAEEQVYLVRESLKTYSGLSELEIEELFNKNNFNVENILEEEYEEELENEVENVEFREIDIINQRINELESKIDEEKTLEELENEKSSKTKELNEQIKKIKSELSNRKNNKTNEQLEKEIELLKKEQNDIWATNQENGNQPSKEDENRFHEINNLIKEIDQEINNRNIFSNKTNEELSVELQKMIEERNELYNLSAHVGVDLTEKDKVRYAELNNKINFIEKEFTKRKNNKYSTKSNEELEEELQKLNEERINLWNEAQYGQLSEKDENKFYKLDNSIKEIKEELNKRKNNKYSNKTSEQLQEELQKMIEERNELYNLSAHVGVDLTEKDKVRYEELNSLIKEYEEELNKRKQTGALIDKSDKELEKALEDLKTQQKILQSEYDKKIGISQELKNLKQIRDAYNKIQSDATNKFKEEDLEEEDLKTAIDNFVNEHDSIKELEKYENADKLKEELKEDIYNNLKTKKIDKKEENKKLFYKGLAGAAGFAAGLVASSVPGVGTLRMGIATAKLAASAVNMWANKHPEGKVATIKNNFVEKHPKITDAVKKMKEKLKSDPLRWAINGFAAGYITGNVIEMVTGETVLEHLKPKDKVPKDTIAIADDPKPDPTPPEPKVETVTEITPSDIELNPGEVYDISALGKGFESSYSKEAVSLMKEVGKNVEVDKFNIVNGEKWVHFKQLNGKGYAWFKEKDVQELLAKAAAKAGSKSL